ncbi:MAG: YicC/YloC family endoribonuclease [Desulfotomaculales bacterium]
MLRSMTGYGRGEAAAAGKRFIVELKSVNHRFCEVVIRLPKNLLAIEERMREQIQKKLFRGRVDCYLTVEEAGPKNVAVKVDKSLVAAYYKAMREILSVLGKDEEPRLEHFLALPGLFAVEEPPENIEEIWAGVEQALSGALASLLEMRRTEGARLREDIESRVGRIEKLNREIEGRAPQVVEEYRRRLSQRVAELVPGGVVDPVRLAGEVALFAERSSIAEEVVRIYSHLGQMRLTCGEEGPVGRKLDFLVQEVNREINTIAHKAGDLQISQFVVEAKSELEKIREQVQNVE